MTIKAFFREMLRNLKMTTKLLITCTKNLKMKKAADSYARASESKTGVINTNKLFSYKYNEDLFQKVMTTLDAKNHGMIFYLDWSGSMHDNMKVLLCSC
nr:MAG: hypothetical protein CM15mV30_0790 [uncultured marine virus]